MPYFIFAFFCLVTMVFVWKLVHETKGKTLEEMEALWDDSITGYEELTESEPRKS